MRLFFLNILLWGPTGNEVQDEDIFSQTNKSANITVKMIYLPTYQI